MPPVSTANPAGGVRMTDFQTAQLGANDRGWTTRGQPEGRAGGANTYDAPHLRYRDYFADMRVAVALRLEPAGDEPTLGHLADALQEPKRPLFIGRKPCLPAASLFRHFSERGDTALAALLATAIDEPATATTASNCCGPKGKAWIASLQTVPTCSPTSATGGPACTAAGGRCVKARRIGASSARPLKRRQKGTTNHDWTLL